MIKIAVCDDDDLELRHLESLLAEYDKEHPGLTLSFESFHSSAELLPYIRKKAFHLYLLDIIMKGENGISMGTAIRNADEKAAIIYTTVSPDYAVQSYTVSAFYYLLKPLDRQILFPILDKVFKSLLPKTNTYFSVRTKDGICPIKSCKVLYIEYHSHRLSYHLENGTIIDSNSFRESFDQAAKSLVADPLFKKVSSSFIVNLAKVDKVTKKGFYMKNGTEINISRTFGDVKKEYLEYLLNGKNGY